MEQQTRPRENWYDSEYIRYWLQQQDGRSPERLRQFFMIRSLIPRRTDEAFRILDVGGGDGWLAQVLLSRFPAATATVLDQSAVMLEEAGRRLAVFPGRFTTAKGDLRGPQWREEVEGLYDVAVSSIAIHNLGDPARIRNLYAEIYHVLADGGCFLNLDYIRAADPILDRLARWASSDPEAGYSVRIRWGGTGGGGRRSGEGTREWAGREPGERGTLEEQVAWLREAGFAPVECFWKEFQTALFGGFRGAVAVPEER